MKLRLLCPSVVLLAASLALSRPVLAQDLALARSFRPLDAAALEALRGRLAAANAEGELEWYKHV